MIILTDAYILAEEAAGRPVNNPRIGYQTYTRDLATSSAIASTTASGAAADAPLRPDTYEYWSPTTLPATWTVDLGIAHDVDYVAIAGHTIGTNSASVRPYYSTDNTNWTAFASALSPGDDAPIMFIDTAKFARYWRIELTGTTMPQLAVIYVGQVLAMERAIYGGVTPPNLSRETVLKNSLSRGGQFLGQNFRRLGLSSDVSFSNLTPTFIRNDFDPFVLSARRFPYFFGWRPSTYPREIVYAWTNKDIVPSNMGKGRLMQVGWPLHGIGY